MKDIADKYRKWKVENPDEGYQYDEVFDFVDSELSRGEMRRLLEYAQELDEMDKQLQEFQAKREKEFKDNMGG